MADEPSEEPGQDQLESLIDDLIRDILDGGGVPTTHGRRSTAALLETAIAAPRAASRPAMLERLLLVEAFASALADALAPALADALAPRVLGILERSTAGHAAGKASQDTAKPPSGPGRRPGPTK